MNLRLGALFVILERWGDNESFVKKCQELALHDPSQIVRGVAFYVIARLFADQPLTDLVKTFRDRHRVKDISQLKNIASSWLDAIQEVRDRVDCGHARWQQLGTVFLYLPETYPGMTQESRQAAQQFLTDPDPRLRRAGIQLLRGKFGATSEFLDHFERLALSDFDEGVRIASLGALIDYYSGTQNQRIGKLLAEMVRNESLSLLFRDIAYQGLFRVHRLPIDDWPEVKRATGRFNFPEDVNWNLVDVLLEPGKRRHS